MSTSPLSNGDRFLVYGGTGHHAFDVEVLSHVNAMAGLVLTFNHIWYYPYPDGEPGLRFPTKDVERIKGRDIIVFSCPITAKLQRELCDIVTGAKRQYGARSITLVMPFMPFRRQDHADIFEEITRLRWFFSDLKHWGVDSIVVCEPHAPESTKKFADEFGIRLFAADPTKIFAENLRSMVRGFPGGDSTKIYSPDLGSVSRALALARALGLTVVATPKRRMNGRVMTVEDKNFLKIIHERYGADAPVACDVESIKGSNLIMREDEVDTGRTSSMTAYQLRQAGAKSVHLVATHPVCSPGWKGTLFPFGEDQPFNTVWLGNTRPRGSDETRYEGSTGGLVHEVDMSSVVAGTVIEALKAVDD